MPDHRRALVGAVVITQRVPRTLETQGRRLLRVLLVRIGSMPAGAIGCRILLPVISRRSRGRTLLANVEIGKLPLQIGDLRQVVDHDVRLVRMMHDIVLVVGLGGIKHP